MKSIIFAGAASVAAIAALSASVSMREASDAVALTSLSPIDIARSVCGDDADAMRKRRAFFVSAAAAWADELDAGDGVDLGLAPNEHIKHAISTDSSDAQALFNEGLAHMWNFNHGAAIASFKQAQAADPACAMCYWAESLAHGPNINAPMVEEAVAPAFAALTMAVANKGSATEKEQALIDALAARYAKNPPADRAPLDLAFAEAMDALTATYPEDDFIAALAAEANMDTQPWNYWAADGSTPIGRTARTISLIEGVLARNPNHIAAIHLYIHITEATDNPYRAAKYADRLDKLSPGLGHLIHMPSHTYFKIGRFKQSMDNNARAVLADEAFIAANDASILYEFGYYTHNVHFLMASAQMAGDAELALDMAKKLDAKLPTDMAIAVPFAQPIKAAPYYAMAQMGDPNDVLALEKPSEAAPFLVGAWRYARAEALVKLGEFDKARAEAEAISSIYADADLSSLTDNGIPADEILKIAHMTALGKAAAGRGDLGSGIEALEAAVEMQDKIAYTEPPYWYYPARQTLASMVLKSGDAERAEQLFMETLVKSPNNAWAYYGLSEAFKAQGDKSGGKMAQRLMKQSWAGDKNALSLDRL